MINSYKDRGEAREVFRSSEFFTVVAVDPGQTTGMARATVVVETVLRDGVPTALAQSARFGMLDTCQVPTPVDSTLLALRELRAVSTQMEWIRQLDSLSRHPVDEVVIEDFLLRQRTMDRSLLSPVRLTAMLQGMLMADQGVDVRTCLQQPSSAKSVVNDERLKKWGMWIRGKQHARDACRHLALRLIELSQ